MSTFSGPSHSEKETDASLYVISYMHPGVTLVPVADSVTGHLPPLLHTWQAFVYLGRGQLSLCLSWDVL